MVEVGNISDWRGKPIIDRDGTKIGKLEEVYVDTETDQPMFGSVKEGLVTKHLTFVPLAGATASPDGLKVAVAKDQVKDAPNIYQDGELDANQEKDLFRHFGLDYLPPISGASPRRLAKR